VDGRLLSSERNAMDEARVYNFGNVVTKRHQPDVAVQNWSLFGTGKFKSIGLRGPKF
jgi:hypothetical protein